MSFAEIVEVVDSLNYSDQELLFEIIAKRRIDARRSEIFENAEETLKAVENGTAKKGTFQDLLSDLEH